MPRRRRARAGTLDTAIWGSELAAGDGRGRIFIAEPTGPIEDDPHLTDRKLPGNPTLWIVGQGSAVRLAEGIGPGSTEAEARAALPGFGEAPHEYSDPPAKYLTAPNAAGGDPALRFEIGADGKVGLIHVGTMPVPGYVEGCARSGWARRNRMSR